jgi:hypothetical protein
LYLQVILSVHPLIICLIGMGAVTSSPATLFVKVDQPVVVAGTTVTGNVYLDVKKPTECTSLVIIIGGSEKTCVHYTTTTHTGTGKNRKSHTHHHHARSRSYFLKVSCPIANIPNGTIDKGNYVYPFSCQIPFGVPSTARVGGSSNCDILYTVEVCLSRPGMTQWDVNHSCPFSVHSAVQMVPQMPLYMEPVFHQVTTCCCFKRGRMILGGAGSSSIVSPGDTMRVHYAVKNSSTASIKSINISLIETVSWKAGSHSASSSRSIFSHRMSTTAENNETKLTMEDLTALKRRSDAEVGEGADQAILFALKQMLDTGTYYVDLTVDPSARSSFAGSLIQIRHRLCIQANTAFGTANPLIDYPVIVVNRLADPNFVPTEVCEDSNHDPAVVPVATPVSYSTLPVGWAPVTAPVFVAPPPVALAVPLQVEPQSADGPTFSVGLMDSAVGSGPFDPAGKPFRALLQAFPSSFDAVSLLERWLQANPALATDLTPSDYGELMRSCRFAFDQVLAAELVARYGKDISCAAIAAAAMGAQDSVRRDVVEKLAAGMEVTDKSNCVLVQQCITPFQYMCVESYFK